MKNYITLLSLFISISLNAQKLSLSFSTGYGFNLAPDNIGEGSFNTLQDLTTEITVATHSYGKGINSSIGIYYSINSNIKAGFNAYFLYGIKGQRNAIFTTSETVKEYRGEMIRFIPSLKLITPINDISVFSEIGGVLGYKGKIINESNALYYYNETTSYSKKVYRGRLSIGAMANIGIQKKITQKITLLLGTIFFVQSLSIKESEVIKSIKNGEDNLENLSTPTRYGNFYNTYLEEATGSTGQPINEPRSGRSFYVPFSSIGFNIGVIYNLKNSNKEN